MQISTLLPELRVEIRLEWKPEVLNLQPKRVAFWIFKKIIPVWSGRNGGGLF